MRICDRIFFYPGSESDILSSNTYLINDKVLAVVDPGSISRLDTLLKHFREDRVNVEDLELIINTHSHFDHCGANFHLQRASRAKIAMHELEEKFLANSRSIALRFGDMMPTFKVDRRLRDGEKLVTGDLIFEVVHTPGHTPGGICLYEPSLKLLFSGDTIFPYGNIGRTDLPGGDPAQLAKSIRRLTGLDVRILAPGHMNIVTEAVNEQIEASLRNAELLL
ncbi:MAG: MBL fold metallo-hydrolase [Candidatus Bathyarchaeia archaeon]